MGGELGEEVGGQEVGDSSMRTTSTTSPRGHEEGITSESDADTILKEP